MPTLEEARSIIESIKINNEIDRRDRAIICFALITGMRISAIASLRMKNFDMENKLINQNPADGVKTKNSKRILTAFFPIGWNEPEKYFLEWFRYLKLNGFQSNDPLFPATKKNFNTNKSSYSKISISRDFWKSTGAIRSIFKKDAERPIFITLILIPSVI